MRRIKDMIKIKFGEQELYERRAVIHSIASGAMTIEVVAAETGLSEERVAEVVRHMQLTEAWPSSKNWPKHKKEENVAR